MAVALARADGKLTNPDSLRALWRERISQARDVRKPFELNWRDNMAFAAGEQWLAVDPDGRTLRHITELDPMYAGRELFTADRIREYLQAAMGELGTDDDRPQLLAAQEGDAAEDVQREINNAVAHAWDYEVHADDVLRRARRMCLTMGVSAIRCRRDPSKGDLEAQVPAFQGKPVFDKKQAYDLIGQGQQFSPKDVRRGQTVWEPLSAFNLLTPPGVNHEDDFPWEVVVRPVLIDDLVAEYGDKAQGLREDTDIASVLGLTTGQNATAKGRLRDHVWLFTAYTRPCRSYRKGQTVVLASSDMQLMDASDELPYQTPDQTPRSGVHYFHWWRLDDRFHSRSLIDALKDSQRIINRRVTQNSEIIDRGMPKVFIKEGDLPHNPQGLPLEKIELKQDAAEPSFFAGIGPGAWMYEDIAHHADNLAHAATLSPLRLGENPQNVDTYGQLALLNDNEQGKRSDIVADQRDRICWLVEDTAWDIRRYWPEQKLIFVSGEDDRIAQEAFQKSRFPDFYVVKHAKGAAKPRGQGAQIKLIDAVWAAAVESAVVATDPDGWTRWYADSLKAGQALELPEPGKDSQVEFARFENQLLLDGEEVSVADYDLPAVHIPEHREMMDQARAAGDLDAYMRGAAHVKEHVAQAQQNAAQVAQAQQTPAPPGLTPAPTAPPAPAASTPAAFAQQDFHRLAGGN